MFLYGSTYSFAKGVTGFGCYIHRALEQLSAAFGHLRKASQTARDVAYLHSLAAAVGLSVKEYQRLLEMFNKIDIEKVG